MRRQLAFDWISDESMRGLIMTDCGIYNSFLCNGLVNQPRPSSGSGTPPALLLSSFPYRLAGMKHPVQSLGETAKFAKSPLGIIALFIVLVYGIASLVTIKVPSDQAIDLLIPFIVGFPVIVLAVFVWLVIKHSDKIYGPSDFANEENFIRLKIAASLGAATGRQEGPEEFEDVVSIARVIELVQPFYAARQGGIYNGNNRILWVDDRPNNNTYEREAFEAIGLQITLALSTDEAIDKLYLNRYGYSVIISDMGRREGPDEGYVLLDKLRQDLDDQTPLFFYAGSSAPQHIQKTRDRGGQGCTNSPRELFKMVTKAVINR